MEFFVGEDRVGDWDREEYINSGGFGSVYACKNRHINQVGVAKYMDFEEGNEGRSMGAWLRWIACSLWERRVREAGGFWCY